MSLQTPFKSPAIKRIKTGIKCEKCGDELVQVILNGNKREPYCPSCTEREKEEQENRNMFNTLKFRQIQRYFTDSVFSDIEQKKTRFEDFEQENKEQKDAYKLMQKVYRSEVNENKPIHAMLIGNVGTGKSHLTSALCLSIIENTSKSVAFVNWRNYQEMRSTAHIANYDDSKKNYIERFERFKEVDVLVIDDLGAEEDRDRNKKAFESIMDARVNKTTIITTNIARGNFQNAYGKRATSRYISCGGKQNIVEMVETKDYRGGL